MVGTNHSKRTGELSASGVKREGRARSQTSQHTRAKRTVKVVIGTSLSRPGGVRQQMTNPSREAGFEQLITLVVCP